MPTERPNVMFLIPHDLGDRLGCYGYRSVRSPNLDRLAAQGARFTHNFATAPECTPSRAGMFTGGYTHQSGLMGLCHRGWEFAPDALHLAQRLGSAGYATHLFGFQHESGRQPERLGYQHVHAQDDKHCGPVSRAAVEFLADAPTDAPWFAHVGFVDVHRASGWPEETSFDPAEIEVPPYLPDTDAVRAELARFHQCIENFDTACGAILDALAASPAADNTLVVFTVDHGIGMPRAKSTFYDPGIRTALLMAWPGRIAPGSTRDELISNVDLCPTLLEACGAPVPESLEGRSFLPLLEGRPYEARDAVCGALYYDAAYDPMLYVRTRRHKLIRSFAVTEADARAADPDVLAKHELGTWIRAGDTDVQSSDAWGAIQPPYGSVPPEELYDLEADPHERMNLADDPARADVLAELRAQLDAMMRRTDCPLLTGHVSPELSSTRNQRGHA